MKKLHLSILLILFGMGVTTKTFACSLMINNTTACGITVCVKYIDCSGAAQTTCRNLCSGQYFDMGTVLCCNTILSVDVIIANGGTWINLTQGAIKYSTDCPPSLVYLDWLNKPGILDIHQ